MNEKRVQQLLQGLAEQQAPKETINLWPAVKAYLAKASARPGAVPQPKRAPRLRLALTITLAVAIVSALFFITPLGKGLGQGSAEDNLRFFTRSKNDQLPLQPFQLTRYPTAISPTPDPASSQVATMSIEEAQQAAGFKVYAPAWLPDTLTFYGASYDKESKIVRVFYRYGLGNGLVLRQEPDHFTDACDLCGLVGASAPAKEVEINGAYGEYVVGVWNLTENGPRWKSDPYLRTMRWEANGMAFELLYMGPFSSLTMGDMLEIAESLQ